MMKNEDEELRLRLEAQRVMDEMMKGRCQDEGHEPRRKWFYVLEILFEYFFYLF